MMASYDDEQYHHIMQALENVERENVRLYDQLGVANEELARLDETNRLLSERLDILERRCKFYETCTVSSWKYDKVERLLEEARAQYREALDTLAQDAAGRRNDDAMRRPFGPFHEPPPAE
jgi:hypothetical protein